MEQQRFLIRGESLSADDPRLQAALAGVYDTPERPRCLCMPGGVEMYVAKHRHFLVKRMPESGHRHHPSCPAFEPEWGTSGLGALMGEAVIERSVESVEVRVDFPLTRRPGRAIPQGEPAEPGEIAAARRGMSLRALMHFLFERAGFNRWVPAMAGKRNQGVLRKYLMEAAGEIETKGIRLSQRLYVPEPFSEAHKAEIAARRREALAVLQAPEDVGQFRMGLVLGELKGSEATSVGRKVWVKHMPDCPLFTEAKAWGRIERRFAALFEAREANPEAKLRLVLCALIYAKREHTYQIDTASLMLATQNWIPIEGAHEVELIQRLTVGSRSFLKPLRYDAPSAAAFPNVLLLDTGTEPLPLHVVSPFMVAQERAAKEKAIEEARDWVCVWRHSERELPLPTALASLAGGTQHVLRKPAFRQGSGH